MTSSGLPKGWRTAELGEICRPDRIAITKSDQAYAKMAYLGLEHIEPATGRILVEERDAQESDSKSTNFRFTTDHVLYGKLRPYLNKVALPEFSGRCTTEIIPLIPLSVERRWLAWLLRRQEVVDHAMHGKTGSRMPRTSMSDFLSMTVAVPSIQVQRGAIARLEGQVAALERARTAARYGAAALSALVAASSRELLPQPHSRLPPGWRWAQLGDLCKLLIGRTPPRANPSYWEGSHGWATIRDLTGSDGVVDDTLETLTDMGAAYCGNRLLPIGALMFSFKLSIGHTAFVGRPLYTNEAIVGLQPRERDSINLRYLRWALRAIDYDTGIEDLVGHAAKGRTLNKRTLAKLDIPVAPAAEQLRIANALDQRSTLVNRAKATTEAQLATIDDLSNATLSEAFRP